MRPHGHDVQAVFSLAPDGAIALINDAARDPIGQLPLPPTAEAIFGRAPGPKGAVWLSGTDHQMESRYDDLLALCTARKAGLLDDQRAEQLSQVVREISALVARSLVSR